jgi:hypothetical protein
MNIMSKHNVTVGKLFCMIMMLNAAAVASPPTQSSTSAVCQYVSLAFPSG